MAILGIDVGGSGIKGAPVDIDTGGLLAERQRVPTPQPSTPAAVAEVIAGMVTGFGWTGRIGVTYPGVVKAGVTLTAANVDPGWIGTDADDLLTRATGCPVTVLNDADAAGLAEVRYGAGRGHPGVVIVITLGTGIGSALFFDGRLLPNTELGHLELRGKDAELRAAARVRDEKKLSWAAYASRLQEYLDMLDKLLWPDLVILGGGISAKAERWLPLLRCRPELRAAALANQAGIVGAALAAHLVGDRKITVSGAAVVTAAGGPA
jgi:polyphosphate glucokinase